jgi:hypothetical protein
MRDFCRRIFLLLFKGALLLPSSEGLLTVV